MPETKRPIAILAGRMPAVLPAALAIALQIGPLLRPVAATEDSGATTQLRIVPRYKINPPPRIMLWLRIGVLERSAVGTVGEVPGLIAIAAGRVWELHLRAAPEVALLLHGEAEGAIASPET